MEFIFIVIILIMSIVIHEVAHGYMALALGDKTALYEDRLTLNPIKHIDPFGSIILPLIGYMAGGFIIGWAKPVPFNPYNLHPEKWGISPRFGDALVAFAGPLSNIILATVFGTMIRFALQSSASFNTPFIAIASSVVFINLTLAIFNLIPVPPLDGSKILFSFLPYKWHGILRTFEQFGMIFVFLFVFFIWQILDPVIMYAFSLLTGFPLN